MPPFGAVSHLTPRGLSDEGTQLRVLHRLPASVASVIWEASAEFRDPGSNVVAGHEPDALP